MLDADRSACHRRGKAITTVIVWLLLGAIVNVAVAWGLSLCLNPLVETLSHSQGSSWRQSIENRSGIWVVWANRRRGSEWVLSSPRRSIASLDSSDAGPTPASLLPKWAAASLTPQRAVAFNDPAFSSLYRTAHATGWPMLSLGGIYRGENGDDPEGMSAMIIGSTPWSVGPAVSGQNTVPRALLLRPLWPGFAVNTVFYAAILWLLFAAPFALRRWRRIERGLCPRCAYDLRGSDESACPECGYRGR